MEDYIFKEENYEIVGILFEVHKNLGKGFSEIVYKDAIEYEFQQNKIPFQREKEFSVNYKNTILYPIISDNNDKTRIAYYKLNKPTNKYTIY